MGHFELVVLASDQPKESVFDDSTMNYILHIISLNIRPSLRTGNRAAMKQEDEMKSRLGISIVAWVE